MCGLWKGLSTLRFGGRKYGFHIFPGREKNTDLAIGVGVLHSSPGDVTTGWTTGATHFFVGLSFPICNIS